MVHNLFGIINVYKEKGITSFDVVAKLRKILNEKKIGHTGTLDPNATGVLPLLIGKGTLISKYLINHDKVYIATLKLGIKTDTGDSPGSKLPAGDLYSRSALRLLQRAVLSLTVPYRKKRQPRRVRPALPCRLHPGKREG